MYIIWCHMATIKPCFMDILASWYLGYLLFLEKENRVTKFFVSKQIFRNQPSVDKNFADSLPL